METQINLLSKRAKILEEEFEKKHVNNNREKKIVKMLEHFNERLIDLKTLNKEKEKHVSLCNFILSDLKEMINQVEYLIKERS